MGYLQDLPKKAMIAAPSAYFQEKTTEKTENTVNFT
jgi:hypothetical protein